MSGGGRALITLAIVLGMAAATQAQTERPLRIVTINLFHGGPYSSWTGDTKSLDERLAMVTEELRALDPDIVTVQEASAGRRRGVVAQRLADALGLHYVFEPATTRLSPVGFFNRIVVALLDFSEGVAVLSRYPITASEVSELPRCRKRLEPRIVLRADVAVPRGTLAVFTTHIAADPCQRRRVAEIAQASTRPLVLTGDLNAVETSEGMEGLNGPGALVDAFRRANPHAAGATVYQPVDSPVATATRRVDYIFVGGPPEAVCGARVVFDRPRRSPDGRTLWPSDHYGVLADLALFGIQCAP